MRVKLKNSQNVKKKKQKKQNHNLCTVYYVWIVYIIYICIHMYTARLIEAECFLVLFVLAPLASKGLLQGAHLCYLTAGVPFGTFTHKSDRLVLLGSSHRWEQEGAEQLRCGRGRSLTGGPQSLRSSRLELVPGQQELDCLICVCRKPFRHFATSAAIRCTELYEYCQTLGGSSFSIPSFQVKLWIFWPLRPQQLLTSLSAAAGVAFRCTSCCTPAACWTAASPRTPSTIVRWWATPSCGSPASTPSSRLSSSR